jgi:Tfp pilus assembly major pilin PilA
MPSWPQSKSFKVVELIRTIAIVAVTKAAALPFVRSHVAWPSLPTFSVALSRWAWALKTRICALVSKTMAPKYAVLAVVFGRLHALGRF